MNSGIEDALHARGPSAELVNENRLYDWLIGSWDAHVLDYADDGTEQESNGEWHFGYVLEGRAIQDVWISPPRSQRDSTIPKTNNRYGTTIRFFHPDKRQWHITWINPVSGAINLLIARRQESDIVQEGQGAGDSLIRWVFTDIENNSARWYGEHSMDGGRTWKLESEFFLKRRSW